MKWQVLSARISIKIISKAKCNLRASRVISARSFGEVGPKNLISTQIKRPDTLVGRVKHMSPYPLFWSGYFMRNDTYTKLRSPLQRTYTSVPCASYLSLHIERYVFEIWETVDLYAMYNVQRHIIQNEIYFLTAETETRFIICDFYRKV